MNRTLISILLFLPIRIFSQIDSIPATNFPAESRKNNLETTDTSGVKIRKLSILHLKTLLDARMSDLNVISKNRLPSILETDLYSFTEEELNSGFSRQQLIAYKKNKDLLLSILAKKYNDSWWYRVKGIDELLGIPSEVFFLLKIALLLSL